MVILSKKAINDFALIEPNATDSLISWYKETQLADWANFAEMKRSFNSVDAVGNDRYVFNTKGINTGLSVSFILMLEPFILLLLVLLSNTIKLMLQK